MTSTATATRSPYTAIREAFVSERRLTIDSGHAFRRDTERRHALRSLVTNPGAVLERHRRDVRAGADVVTTATWGLAAAAWLSTEPDRWMAVARRGIQLAVGQNAVIDVKLDVGRIAEEMTVTGASPTIGEIPTTRSRRATSASRMPGTARIGAMEITGFDGHSTIVSAAAMASSTPGAGRAAPAPS